MPSRTLFGVGLTGFWDRGADYKAGMDDNLLKLSALSQLVVESRTTSLPSAPSDGVIYIAPSDGRIAVRDNGAWTYISPAAGWTAFVKDTGTVARYSGSAWATVTVSGIADAPSDGTTYGRRNGAWVAAGGGSSTLIGITAASLPADFTVTSGAWLSPTSWTINRDNLSSYASGSDFTVPSGAALCRVKMLTVWTGGGSVCYAMAFDTTDYTTYIGDIRDRNNEAFSSASGPLIACTPGRTIRFRYNGGSGTGGLAGASGTTFGKPTRIEIEWFSGWPV